MTSQGSALTRFRRAIATRNPLLATTAAHELGYLSLADALALTLLYADEDEARFERAAVRWHGRLCIEAGGLAAADAGVALAAVRGLTGGNRRAAAKALGAVLDAIGQGGAARVVEDWATGPCGDPGSPS